LRTALGPYRIGSFDAGYGQLVDIERLRKHETEGHKPHYETLCNSIQQKRREARKSEGESMKATQELHDLGQSLWLDNITRDLLENGTLKRYIDEFSVTGLTSNPTIFEHAISKSKAYDPEIGHLTSTGLSGEELFFELALQDLTRAADLFASVNERTAHNDGFVSLEVSPLLAYDTEGTISAAITLHKKANRPNLFIKIPGTKEGNLAIEGAIAAGVPINVTLLFSLKHYLESADAYMRGLEQRIAKGLSPDVRSVSSIFVSRWDGATMEKVPDQLRNKLGIAIGQQVYKAYRDILASGRWQRLANFGARPQRLLFASTGTKDPKAPDDLYISALAAPNTVNTMPEKTLLAFGDHGRLTGALSRDGGDCEAVLDSFRKAGIDLEQLAADLQSIGAKSFSESWQNLLGAIKSKADELKPVL
jgi:transaldolase